MIPGESVLQAHQRPGGSRVSTRSYPRQQNLDEKIEVLFSCGVHFGDIWEVIWDIVRPRGSS